MKKTFHNLLRTMTLLLTAAVLLCGCAFAEEIPLGSAYVAFGHYEQDGDLENGPEPILWNVLGEKKGKVLLLSMYGLTTKPYNHVYEKITWYTCSMRAWLNGEFMDEAFSPEERPLVLKTYNNNSRSTINPAYWQHHKRSGGSIDTGNDSNDYVFLLSYKEMEEYLPDPARRGCEPTPYAKQLGAYWTETNGCGWWWLRSMGSWKSTADVVYTGGTASEYDVVLPNMLVRPAIWVNKNCGLFD